MKKIFYLLFIVSSLKGFTQNLVPNPSFEQYTICPANLDELSRCQGWSSFSETPDYYNNCALPSTNVSIPINGAGFQYPHSANAYVGFYTYLYPGGNNNRELIGAQLLSLLVIGQKYFISFYVNLSGAGSISLTSIATDKIGVKFSTVPYSYSNPASINNFAHFYTDSIITDTAKWTFLKGSFIADSAYNYIIIGNFFSDSLTNIILPTGSAQYAYYYIDDVCVSTDSLYCENWLGVKEQSANKKEITIYPNPCTNELNVKYNNIPNEQITLSIIDIFGKIVMQAKTQESEYVFNTGKLAKGLYLVKVETAGKVELQKVTKE